jgi:hypothetical protein
LLRTAKFFDSLFRKNKYLKIKNKKYSNLRATFRLRAFVATLPLRLRKKIIINSPQKTFVLLSTFVPSWQTFLCACAKKILALFSSNSKMQITLLPIKLA